KWRYWPVLFILLFFSPSAPVTEAMGSVSALRFFTVVNENNEPLPGVGIIKKGTYTSCATNIDGKCFLPLQPTHVVTVLYYGYKTQEITITYAEKYNIKLVPLPEVPEPKEPEKSSSGYFFMY